MSTKDLTVTEQLLPAVPSEVLIAASEAAKALTNVLAKKPKKVIINKEQYLEFEDWQTMGQFYGYTVKTYEAEPVEIDGTKGAKARADLIDFKTGLVVGGAEAYCMSDEQNWKNKPWFQLASMAQTRAAAKAFRNRLAWVVVLAGYRPTPAEEMDGMVTTKAKVKPAPDLYPEDPPNAQRAAEKTQPVTKEQINSIVALLKENDMSLGALGKWMVEKGWTVRKLEDIVVWQYEEILEAFKKGE